MKNKEFKIVITDFFTGEKSYKKIQAPGLYDADLKAKKIRDENPSCIVVLYFEDEAIIGLKPKQMGDELDNHENLEPLEIIEFMSKWKIDILTLEQEFPDFELPEDESLFEEEYKDSPREEMRKVLNKIKKRGRPLKATRAPADFISQCASN